MRSRLGLSIEKLSGMDRKIWWPISRQLYSDVARHGKSDRIDTFNGNYGLNRGLAGACFVLGCVAVATNLLAAGLLLFLSIVYAYRAYRFGVHYGRELYIQFLTINETTPKSPKKKDVQDKA